MKKLWNRYSYAIVLLVLSVSSALLISYQSHSFDKKAYVNVTISEGDSLWKIADQYSGDYSLSKDHFISWVKKHNNIEGDQIFPGEKIAIPVKSGMDSTNEFASATDK